MKTIVILYLINVTLLLLHEIESAYEKEWEILKLPGKITGFLILHVPVITVLLYGLLEIDRTTSAGLVIGMISGVGGAIPFLVHQVFVKRKNRFNRPVSILLIYANLLAGISTFIFSLALFILK